MRRTQKHAEKCAKLAVTQDAANGDWLGSNPLFTQYYDCISIVGNTIRSQNPILNTGLEHFRKKNKKKILFNKKRMVGLNNLEKKNLCFSYG